MHTNEVKKIKIKHVLVLHQKYSEEGLKQNENWRYNYKSPVLTVYELCVPRLTSPYHNILSSYVQSREDNHESESKENNFRIRCTVRDELRFGRKEWTMA